MEQYHSVVEEQTTSKLNPNPSKMGIKVSDDDSGNCNGDQEITDNDTHYEKQRMVNSLSDEDEESQEVTCLTPNHASTKPKEVAQVMVELNGHVKSKLIL